MAKRDAKTDDWMGLGELRELYDDLRAAVLARVPVCLTERPGSNGVFSKQLRQSKNLTLDDLNRLEKETIALGSLELEFQAGNGSEGTVDTPQSPTTSALPSQLWAAIQTFLCTRSTLPILESLTVHQLVKRDVSRAMRWTFTYLAILILVAAVGLILFAFGVVPVIESMRAEMFFPDAVENPGRFELLGWLPWIAIAWALLLLLALAWLLGGGFMRSALWLGGRALQKARIASVALQNCQFMVANGKPVIQTIPISCDLVAATDSERDWIEQLVLHAESQDGLSAAARVLKIESSRRLIDLRTRIPLKLTVLVGGVLTLVYCLLLFWPIISLLGDLILSGFGG